MKEMRISVGGRELPCRLTMGAMLLFKRQTGKDLNQIQGEDLEAMLTLLWCCVKSACRADGVEFNVDFEMFCDMITPEEMALWNKAMETEQDKKKAAGIDDRNDEDPVGIEELLGIAMGCMGMSMMDFCLCTPSEFYETWKVWNEMQLRREREAWERARMECLCTLQPWSKKRLKARDVMRFEWDDNSVDSKCSRSNEMSREEIMKRYREARRKVGME